MIVLFGLYSMNISRETGEIYSSTIYYIKRVFPILSNTPSIEEVVCYPIWHSGWEIDARSRE